jgi:hypothetical protein
MRPRLLMPLTIAVALVAMLLPSLAQADFQTLFNDYRADGTIDGCNYSQSDLSAGLSSVPSDVRQYDPAFSDAINAALEQAAAGCNASPSEASSIKNEISAADGSPGPAPPKGLALASPGDAREIPAVLIALMVALGAALGAAAMWLAVRRYGRGASSASQPNSSGF